MCVVEEGLEGGQEGNRSFQWVLAEDGRGLGKVGGKVSFSHL